MTSATREKLKVILGVALAMVPMRFRKAYGEKPTGVSEPAKQKSRSASLPTSTSCSRSRRSLPHLTGRPTTLRSSLRRIDLYSFGLRLGALIPQVLGRLACGRGCLKQSRGCFPSEVGAKADTMRQGYDGEF